MKIDYRLKRKPGDNPREGDHDEKHRASRDWTRETPGVQLIKNLVLKCPLVSFDGSCWKDKNKKCLATNRVFKDELLKKLTISSGLGGHG